MTGLVLVSVSEKHKEYMHIQHKRGDGYCTSVSFSPHEARFHIFENEKSLFVCDVPHQETTDRSYRPEGL